MVDLSARSCDACGKPIAAAKSTVQNATFTCALPADTNCSAFQTSFQRSALCAGENLRIELTTCLQ
jgi:hypothetical protein